LEAGPCAPGGAGGKGAGPGAVGRLVPHAQLAGPAVAVVGAPLVAPDHPLGPPLELPGNAIPPGLEPFGFRAHGRASCAWGSRQCNAGGVGLLPPTPGALDVLTLVRNICSLRDRWK